MNANNEGTLGENTYKRKYGWQRKRRVVVNVEEEEEKPAPSPIDFSHGSYEYESSLPIVQPMLFGWMQYYLNLPIAPGLPDLPDTSSYGLPDLPDRLPDLPDGLCDLCDLCGGGPSRSTGEDVDENEVKYTSNWMKKIEKITKKI
jgi:hypothetical protein